MANYSFDWKLPESIGRKISMTDVKLADTLKAGLFEHAVDNWW